MTDATAAAMTTAAEPDGAPRIGNLDIFRGIAILGILFMNINAMGGALFMGFVDVKRYAWSDFDKIAFALRNVLADGTARCLLEMLFGVGMVILTDRAAKAAEGKWTVLRGYYLRNFVLFLFGLVHIFVILWPGDILHTYGIAAMLAFLFRRLSARWLLAVGLLYALFMTGGGAAGYYFANAQIQQVAAIEAKQKAGQAITPGETRTLKEAAKGKAERDKQKAEFDQRMKAEDVARSAGTGTFQSWVSTQWGVMIWLWSLFLEPIWIWEAAGTMLIGAALFRWGVIQGQRSARFYLILTTVCYAIGLTLRANAVVNEMNGYHGPTIDWATNEIGRLLATLGHIGLLNLLLTTGFGRRLLKPFDAAGRTALTIYIAQSIICLWILYPPWALGLYGKNGWGVWMVTALIVDAVLLLAANWYVTQYKIAPVEWAWRSILARRALPIRRGGSATPGAVPQPA